MTSQARPSSATANIVWDKSRLHAQRPSVAPPLRNGHGLGHGHGHGHGHQPSLLSSPTTRISSSRAPTTRHSSSAITSNGGHLVRAMQKSSQESELVTSFDPMKDLHMWTMWRVAVNGRIVDETRRRNRAHAQAMAQTQAQAQAQAHAHPHPSEAHHHNGPETDWNPFGRALIKTPLDRFIRVENGSREMAEVMMDPHNEGGGHLGTNQFVFFGVPRVVLRKQKDVVQLR